MVLIVVGLFLIWWDHHRIVLRNQEKGIDPESLKGRTLKLRDDMQAFLDSVGSAQVARTQGETQRDYATRAFPIVSKRVMKLIHGYELRFAKDAERVHHEFGERGISDGEFNNALTRQAKNEDAFKMMIEGLARLAERSDISD
jgi:hypothetical protein